MSTQNMHYLTVNDEDYYYRSSPSPTPTPTPPLSSNRHKHKGRSAASPMHSVSMASTPDLSSISEMSFGPDEFTSSTESSPSLTAKKRHKSIDNLCFGVRNRKKMHRKTHITESPRGRCYTEPQMKHGKVIQHQIPILKVPTDDEATDSNDPSSYSNRRGIGSLLKQTLKVTTASMGFRTLSAERLAPYTSRPLSEDVKRRFSR